MMMQASYWKKALNLGDARVGRKVRVRIGVEDSTIKLGVVTNSSTKRCIVELENGKGEVTIEKNMLPALEVWYDLEEEKKLNDEEQKKKLAMRAPGYHAPYYAMEYEMSSYEKTGDDGDDFG